MDDENTSRAMGYVCVDLVRTIHDLDLQARRVARRLGYDYAGLTKSSSLIVPEALLDHVATHRIELLIVPDLGHLRGRIPPELAELTDIHNLATGQTHERPGGYAPDEGATNPLAADAQT
ncbi:hypothetical protein IRT45_05975 [Nocardia sp. BSTN01]|uniref:hypothetical protein n=1 Tax=Nocardia sp. BSTN01 TaxID=2783665 RepID=UPI00188E9087|nr:hypothetical protein [Nocardia sp. BSTN01]MBF4996702.1 hypothetical protein [Nocardia sp. BSTN01]